MGTMWSLHYASASVLGGAFGLGKDWNSIVALLGKGTRDRSHAGGMTGHRWPGFGVVDLTSGLA